MRWSMVEFGNWKNVRLEYPIAFDICRRRSIRHCGIMDMKREMGLRYQGICDYGYNLEL